MKEDHEFNVEFVKVVQKYPVLYDVSHPLYSKRQEATKAWNSISKDVNVTVQDCKYRWKVLRVSLSRSLKQQGTDNEPNKKPYYLMEHMQFVIPFIKTWKPTPDLPPFEYSTHSESDDEATELSDGVVVPDEAIHRDIIEDKTIPKTKRNKRKIETPPSSTSNDLKDRKTDNEATPDIGDQSQDTDFMQAVLIEMNKMDNYQKSKFKLAVLNTISDIFSKSSKTS